MRRGKITKRKRGKGVRNVRNDAWQHRKSEVCQNPFRKRRCNRTDIVLLLMHNHEQLPICSLCWKKLSEMDWHETDSQEEFIYLPMEGAELDNMKGFK